MTNKIIITVIVALIVGGIIGYAMGNKNPTEMSSQPTPDISQTPSISESSVKLQNDMRELWQDHVSYTRLYIVESVGELPAASSTAERLMQNQEDIGDAINSYYGSEAGTKLTELLKEHIEGAVALLSAAKAGDNTKLDEAKKAWYANGDEIAMFLSSANPKNWPEDDMKDMMKKHLDQTLAEATAQLQGNYTESIKKYDEIVDHILEMSDALSDGIVKQFPDKF